MKTLLTLLFTGLLCFAQAQIHVDSARIVQLNDTLYGVALYGVVMPSGPCSIIESSEYATNDTITISLCYLYGNAASALCRGYDTVPVGDLNSTGRVIIVALARTDTVTNTCINPQKRDTIVLQYIPTGITNVESDYSLQLFPNPAGNMLRCNTTECVGTGTMQIISVTGQLLFKGAITQPDFTVDLSPLPPGVYFLQLTDSRQRIVKRFVKE
jgi:hypothetical protein